MTILEMQPFFDDGTCTIHQVVDDRNQPARPDRWRTVAIRTINNSPVQSYFAYVQDPATGAYFPAADPNNPSPDDICPPLTTREWTVPAQFQGSSPDEYNWGARAV